MFCANHDMNLGEALQRAKKEFDDRPNNLDVLETYAWTLFKNGRPVEAIPLIEKVMQMNAHSYSLLHHASMIYAAAGMKHKAEALRNQAKKENPFVNALSTEGNLIQPSAPTPVASLQ